MIQMVAPIVATHVVSDPLAAGMNVRSFRMPLKIAKTALISSALLHGSLLLDRGLPLLDWGLPLLRNPLLRSLSSCGSGSTRRNVSTANATLATLAAAVTTASLFTLCETRNRKAERQQGQK
jgi:hypothetical protein